HEPAFALFVRRRLAIWKRGNRGRYPAAAGRGADPGTAVVDAVVSRKREAQCRQPRRVRRGDLDTDGAHLGDTRSALRLLLGAGRAGVQSAAERARAIGVVYVAQSGRRLVFARS